MYNYVHDIDSKTVYRIPKKPSISTKNDRNGKLISYHVSMQYDAVSATNRLRSYNEWEKPVSPYVEQLFDNRYDEEMVVIYFYRHHSPKGQKISREEYEVLKSKYESIAKMNKF